MKKIFLLAIIVTLGTSTGQSQKLRFENNGRKIFQNDTRLTFREVRKVMNANPEALVITHRGMRQLNLGQALGFTSGVLVGINLGKAIRGGTPNWYTFGLGGLLLFMAVPITTGALEDMKKGINLYNNKPLGIYSKDSSKYKISMLANGSGIGLHMKF